MSQIFIYVRVDDSMVMIVAPRQLEDQGGRTDSGGELHKRLSAYSILPILRLYK